MKKTIIVLAAALLPFVFNGCGGGGTSSPKNEADSVAYAIGIDIGRSIHRTDSTLNPNVIASGLKDGYNKKNKWEHEEAVNYLREYFTVRKPAKAKAEGEAFLQDVESKNRNIQKTESGLLYEIIEPGDMSTKPADLRDKVTVHYEGRTKDDKVFDSSLDKEPAEFALNRVIKGWGEGLQLVGKGGKIKLYIPTDLAYGAGGSQNPMTGEYTIGPNEPLIFDVELLDVEPYEAPAE